MSLERYLQEAGCTLIKPSGTQWIACCPFHADTHRSFAMNAETGQFCCYAEHCGAQGGLLSFLVEGCSYSYKKALRVVETLGLWSDFNEGAEIEELPDWKSRHGIGREAAADVKERMLGLYDFCPTYMRQRGFTKQILRKWEVGFDFELNRVTFPVRNDQGILLGFSKRAINDEYPKYLHLGFKKSQVMYGAHFVGTYNTVWVGEGQTDVIALDQFGVTDGAHVVSTMGARVSDDQVMWLRAFKTVLVFDNDADGRSATKRIGDKLLEWGHRDVYVASSYPDGAKDPGMLVRYPDKTVRRFLAELESYDLWRLQ